jgi:hypothetical protein
VRRFRLSVRARILSIALIPSFTLLAVGVGASTYLAVEAYQLRDEVEALSSATGPSIEFARAMQEERRLSLVLLSGDQSVRGSLDEARQRVDQIMTSPELAEVQYTIQEVAPDYAVGETNTTVDEVTKAFAQLRPGVDAGMVPPDQVSLFFNTILDRFMTGTRGVANALPDPDAVGGASIAVELSDAVESMSRGNALGVAVVGRMTPEQFREYSKQVGSYHNRLEGITPALSEAEQDRVEKLVASREWQTLSTMENAIIDRGAEQFDVSSLPVSVEDWQTAAATVSDELLDLYQDHYTAVVEESIDNAGETAMWWLIAAGALLVGAVLASMVTLRISSGLIRRLKRLRGEALSMADEQLPRIMTRLRNGENVDVTTEIHSLDFGDDEIGDVAEAFNRAESAAVTAAVEEARTRGGISALFLNIAHRSQVIVHKQLELLDQAEHGEEDPNRLSVLFQLDHLSTRARRNAENLIILGGEAPGRQWRNPVPLVDMVRSAIAETEDYARVHTGHMANVSIVGSVVADLIHLIAEIVENATSFSPPESRVDVTGNVVGKGVVVEIVDQGLGMARDEIARANEILREPPNFSVANLSSDSRMGLLVVGQIAARNGVTIRLSDSDYGGIRAIVLIPTSLIADDGRTTGNLAMAVNGAPARNGARTEGSLPSVPWPTMEPGDATPPPRHAAHPEPRTARREPVAENPAPAPAAEHGIQPTVGRPALPRRRRQSNMAPQLANSPQPQQPQPSAPRRERSSEHARDLFSAIESGTRQGRMLRGESGMNYDDGYDGREGYR